MKCIKQIVLIPLFSLFSLVLSAQNTLKVSDKKTFTWSVQTRCFM